MRILQNRSLFLIVLVLLSNVFTMPSVQAIGNEQVMNEKILKQWSCPGSGRIQLEFKFRLNKEGDISTLSLTKGFDDPFAIRSAVHALLFAMPFKQTCSENLLYTCTISGDTKSPNVSICSSISPLQSEEEAINKLTQIKTYKHHTFLFGEMAVRLRELCIALYNFSDSSKIVNEIEKICSFQGLSIKKSHDWVCISRAYKSDLVISRNPKHSISDDVFASIAALLQALQLKRDKVILLELEEAFDKLIAIDILNASKADPLLLGSAAILTDQLKFAQDQLSFAAREGKTEAKTYLELIKSMSTGEIKKIVLSEGYTPTRDNSAWQALLKWLPTDTESVAFEAVHANEKVDSMSFFSRMVFGNILNDGSMNKEKPIHPLKSPLFEGISNSFCFLAARKFKVARVASTDIAGILVFPESSKQTAKKIWEHLKTQCTSKGVVEGVEVIAFSNDASFFSSGTCNYVCSPCEGIILSVSTKQYLQEILLRLRNQPNDGALPKINPEWKFVDTDADHWIVRHFDQSYVPFDNVGMYNIVSTIDSRNPKEIPEDKGKEIGLTFHSKNAIVTVHQLSTNQATLEGLARRWPFILSSDHLGREGKTDDVKVSIKDNVLSVEGKAKTEGMLGLNQLVDFGFFVEI